MNLLRNINIGTLLLSFITFISYLSATDAFEYSAYCHNQCMIGRGGNLCRCNAVHFAGKRTDTLLSDKAESYNGLLDKDGMEVGRLLSYILNREKEDVSPNQEQKNDQDYVTEDADNVRYVGNVKRFPVASSGPYRSWYGGMRDALRRKYSHRFTDA